MYVNTYMNEVEQHKEWKKVYVREGIIDGVNILRKYHKEGGWGHLEGLAYMGVDLSTERMERKD